MSMFSSTSGPAMDCRMLRCLVYSMAAGAVLVLAGLLFVESPHLATYLFAVSLIPASAMISGLILSIRCMIRSKTAMRETIVVGVKPAMDTLQLLELTPAGRYSDPLAGTHRFCLSSGFMFYFGMTSYPALMLLPSVLGICMGAEELNLFLTMITELFASGFLLAFWLEYHTCCKRAYPAGSMVARAAIVRGPWVSYIELGGEVKGP
ncbi:MAG: hypothetical protein FWH47_04495 [Methanomassiliicoccaceae archaeon]|nr:hypothetical protein [Methanomassiliicoccaceae archaeon]